MSLNTDGLLINGQLRAYTDVGGYPIIYLTKENDVLCSTCATTALTDALNPPTSADVYWEGDPYDCDGCGYEIESAYGVPDENGKAPII